MMIASRDCALRQRIATRLRTVTVIFATVLGLANTPAALLFYDGFDYPAGEELGERVSNPPWENDKRPFTVLSGNLSYPPLRTSTGNHLHVESASPNLDSVRTGENAWPPQTNGTLYLSFLLQLQSTNGIRTSGNGTSLLTIGDTEKDSELFGLQLRQDGTLRLGLLNYAAATPSVAFFESGPGADLAADGSTTYLVVAKYDWGNGTTQGTVSLWVNPASLGAVEPTQDRLIVQTETGAPWRASRLTLSRGPHVRLDELRIGQTWADVTPIPPPPYRWILIIGVLTAGLAAAALWITQLRRKVAERSAALKVQIEERQRVEQQRLMDQERSRIAQDLHDELGADVTEISMLATRVQGNPGNDEGHQCLEQLAGKSREMVSKLEEIVWAMNPEHDSVGALVSYCLFYADRFLQLAGIKLVVDTSEEARDLAVEARMRHQLFLVFKEALANVVRHSKATEVRIVVRVDHARLQVELADNGVGMQTSTTDAPGGHGLANMRRRLEQIGGRFEISGEAGQGTTVRFSATLTS